jgi:hypothetical protein
MNRKHFEKDDFANDKEIAKNRQIRARFEAMIDTCSATLAEKLALSEEVAGNLEQFVLYQQLREPETIYTKQSATLPLQVSLVEIHNLSARNGNHSRDYIVLGNLLLQREFPLTHIYEETIGARVADWFLKGDVDFKECKKFSRRFHVISQDREKLRLLLSHKPLDELTRFPHLQLEIHGRSCVFRVSAGLLDEDHIDEFIALVNTLKTIFL